jgi:hypothetical protein
LEVVHEPIARKRFTVDLRTERMRGNSGGFERAGLDCDGSGNRSNSWKGTTAMAIPEPHDPGDVGLVFVAHNNHDERCGPPPRLRNTDNPGLYHGYFENRYGEQFVLTFNRATTTGTVSGGDLGWGEPRSFTLALLDEALRSTRNIAAEIGWEGLDEASKPPVIDAALGLGRLTGLTGKDEIIWLRACLEACGLLVRPSD